jgi:hypothetical protein
VAVLYTNCTFGSVFCLVMSRFGLKMKWRKYFQRFKTTGTKTQRLTLFMQCHLLNQAELE